MMALGAQVVAKQMDKYSTDYSKWDTFASDDEEVEEAQHDERAASFVQSESARRVLASFDSMSASQFEDPIAWTNGLSDERQHNWLCACFLKRALEGHGLGKSVGILDPEATPESVARELLVFCRMAKATGAIPLSWNWTAYFAAVARHITYPLEAHAIEERLTSEELAPSDSEPVSMRFVASSIYLCGAADAPSPVESRARDLCASAFTEDENAISLYDRVGGAAVWHAFVEILRNSATAHSPEP